MKVFDILTNTKAGTDELTATQLKEIFNSVNNDPEAGLGCLSREAIVIDMIMRRWNVCIAKYRGLKPRDKGFVVRGPEEVTTSPVAEKAASATNAAGM